MCEVHSIVRGTQKLPNVLLLFIVLVLWLVLTSICRLVVEKAENQANYLEILYLIFE